MGYIGNEEYEIIFLLLLQPYCWSIFRNYSKPEHWNNFQSQGSTRATKLQKAEIIWIAEIVHRHIRNASNYIVFVMTLVIWKLYPILNGKWKNRSSRSEVFLGKTFLKICRKYPGENLCRSVISTKLQSNFIETTLQHVCSPVYLLYIFRTPFLKSNSGWLLLETQRDLDDLNTFL